MPEDSYQRLRFDPTTRRDLAGRYEKEWRKAMKAVGSQFIDEDTQGAAEEYVSALEIYAEHARDLLADEPDGQKRRREKVEALANALDNVIQAALNLDEPALGFALWRGIKEMQAADLDTTQADREWLQRVEGWPTLQLVHDLRRDGQPALQNFALGVRKAIGELPGLDRHTQSVGETIARQIEETLERSGIAFTTSATGLAGRSFHAVFDLAGAAETPADYQLRKAKDHPDSWRNFIQRMRDRFRDSS